MREKVLKKNLKIFGYFEILLYLCTMKFFKTYTYSLSVAFIIGVLLLVPMPEDTSLPLFPNADKMVHAFLFALLTFVLYWEQTRSHARVRKPIVYHILIPALPLLYGAALEIAQQYCTTYRSGSQWDMLADAIGVGMGWLLALIWCNPSKHAES